MVEALIAYLSAAVPLWLLRAPQGAVLPYTVLVPVSRTMDQEDLNGSGAVDFRFQLDVYAASHAEAETRAAVLRALVNRPGSWFDLGDWHVGYCRIEQEQETVEELTAGGEATCSRIMIEFLIRAEKED
ncbi:MAG: DUF3168 domain-containing protein [Victivallaceae bacterium]|nr:DUF3168 domain-containing protein [Victivallaceae bacterium]